MNTIKAVFNVSVNLKLEYKKGAQSSKHRGTEFVLDMTDNLNRDLYIDNEGLPNQEGSKVISNVLIQGLVANIHMAHEQGFRDSAEHLRWIISELERGFVTVAESRIGTFTHLNTDDL